MQEWTVIRMTLNEAIKHCLEVADKHERHAKILDRRLLGSGLNTADDCRQCAADHRQLAEWLTELKELKAADVKPVQFSEPYWIREENIDSYWFICSNCGKESGLVPKKLDYCPHCKKKMNVQKIGVNEAIKCFNELYDKALKMDFIKNPLAWALYHTWKYVDKGNGQRNGR